ncbi:MAG: CoA ester lyase [Chloroflexota bacterium]|nr:CoA ester lyase [Chloroflexota bacterium]
MEFMRSLMFVPGHRQRMIDKALASAADVLFLDIEDGVPPAEKDTARQCIAESLRNASSQPGGPHPLRFVRINAIGHERMRADLDAVVTVGIEGLCLPKVEDAGQIELVDSLIEGYEASAGIRKGTIRYIAAIESARGIVNGPAVAAASPRLVGLMFGAEDFAKDLGLPTQRVQEASELIYARSALVMAAASAHIGAIDGVWPDIRDPEGLLRDARQARRLGFTGKSLIHPGQIETVNGVFCPDEGEVDYARQVVTAFEEAVARGDGSIAIGGQLVDLPIVERARRVLWMNEQLAGS